MDKLQPIIKQRFWILLGLVAPLTIFGYYKANGAMRAATEERIGQLDGLQVPSGNEENPRWAQGLKEINTTYEQSVNAEIVRIWERQQARMTWPAPMQQYLPENYRDPFTNQAGVVYANLYPQLLRDLHASIEPVTVTSQGKISPTGKVLFEEKQIPRSTFEGRLSIPSEMIWDAQEDIWQLQLLFDAIRKMNRPAPNAAKSAIRAVYKVELWGGSGESSVKGSGVGGGSGEGLAAMGEMGSMMEMMRGGMDSGMGGGGQTVKVAFNPEEEFGTGGQPAGAIGGQGQMMGGRMNMGSMAMGPADGPGESLSTTQQPTKTLRYVKDSDSTPYHERGFYLSVLIDQRRIADFLVELTNSDWPIRIGRFHVGPNTHGGKGLPSRGMGGMDGMMLGMDGGGFGGSAEVAAQMEMMMNLGSEAEGNPFEGGLEMEGGAPTPTLNPTGEAVGLLQQFDLVQLDVAGYITFYKRPAPELLAAVQQASQEAAAPAAAAPPAIDAGAPTESSPETDTGSPAGEAGSSVGPAGESTDPAQPDSDPAASPPADSPTGDASATDGASPPSSPDAGSGPSTEVP